MCVCACVLVRVRACVRVPVQVVWVDPDEAGTLLEALGPHAFDQSELLPVEEGPVLLPPLGDAACPPSVQTRHMPREHSHFSQPWCGHHTGLIYTLRTLRRYLEKYHYSIPFSTPQGTIHTTLRSYNILFLLKDRQS